MACFQFLAITSNNTCLLGHTGERFCRGGITRWKEEYLNWRFSYIQLNWPADGFINFYVPTLYIRASFPNPSTLLSIKWKKQLCQHKRQTNTFVVIFIFLVACEIERTHFICILELLAHFSVELWLLNYNYCKYFFTGLLLIF